MEAKRRTRSFWEHLVAESNERGVAAVARAHGVKDRTLVWWRWRLKRDQRARVQARRSRARGRVSTPPDPELLPVFVAAAGEHGAVELKVGDVTIRVERDADVSYVAALVAAIRGAC